MPKINITKYEYGQGYKWVHCFHCKKPTQYYIVSHYEDKPKKKDGKYVVPLALVRTEVYDVSPPNLCVKCKAIPKCKFCEIILCNWDRHYPHAFSDKYDDEYCNSCFEFELLTN